MLCTQCKPCLYTGWAATSSQGVQVKGRAGDTVQGEGEGTQPHMPLVGCQWHKVHLVAIHHSKGVQCELPVDGLTNHVCAPGCLGCE